MTATTETQEVPGGVLLLAQRAVGGDLLGSTEAMAAALTETGWVRGTGSGSWSYAADASWSVHSGDHAPNLSIFSAGEDEHLLHVAGALRTLMDSGRVGAVRPGEPDPDVGRWFGGEVVFSLYASTQRRMGKHLLPGAVQLAIERADTPSEGLAVDPQRARLLAREGSPIARWYLAGHEDLPQDVEALLAADEDAAVVAALNANEGHRRLMRDAR